MRNFSFSIHISALLAYFFCFSQAQFNNVTTPALNMTGITAINGSSVFECWQLPGLAVFTDSPGLIGALGMLVDNITDVEYVAIPPRFYGGLHNPAVPQ